MGDTMTLSDWYWYGHSCGEHGWGWLRTVAGQCLTHAERGSLADGWRAGQDAARLREAVAQANAEAAEQRAWERARAGEPVPVCDDDEPIPF